MSFFVNPAIAAGVLLTITSLSSVAHAAVPPQQPTCSVATISGTYQGRGSGKWSFKVEPKTHNVRMVFDGKGNYSIEATDFVRGRQTQQAGGAGGSYTVDGACNVVFTRVISEHQQAFSWIGTVTPNGNNINRRIELAEYKGSEELIRVPPR